MYFIWQLINILAIISLIIYAIKFIYNFKKHKVKSISYLVVTLGFLIVSNLIIEKNSNGLILNTASEIGKAEATYINKTINLIDALVFDVNIDVKLLIDTTKITPVKATTLVKGFSNGFDWELQNFTIQRNQDGTIRYTATGILDWKVLGISSYSQTKEYIGNFKIE